MAKLLSLVLGLLVLSFIAYKVVGGHTGATAEAGTETPPQTLENARKAAKRIETESLEKADKDLKAGDEH